MKLAVLGGGGVRMPLFVRAVLSTSPERFQEVRLFEPDQLRRETIGRLCIEIGDQLGKSEVVSVTDDAEEALSGVDFVFSAIRVGGDEGRVVDEEIALERAIVGQETTGAGGCAMALRTIPVVLGYCDVLRRVAPRAVLVNFTNPAGIVTQAIAAHGGVRAVGVCDTPSSTVGRLGEFLDCPPDSVAYGYGGLNHLGWITSLRTEGTERIDELVDRFDELRCFDRRFAAFDSAMVAKLGVIPCEYVYYYYDPRRYLAAVSTAGRSRGRDVARLNGALLAGVAAAWENGSLADAWATYSRVMGVRHDTYMNLDLEGRRAPEPAASCPDVEPIDASGIGGYEAVALRVIDGMSGGDPTKVIVNTLNAGSLGFLDDMDVVEVPALIGKGGIDPLTMNGLPRSARALVCQVKEYERQLVDAAVSASAEKAALALAVNPLVPGVTAARDLVDAYREGHVRTLGFLK